jgi:hypothetical protein
MTKNMQNMNPPKKNMPKNKKKFKNIKNMSSQTRDYRTTHTGFEIFCFEKYSEYVKYVKYAKYVILVYDLGRCGMPFPVVWHVMVFHCIQIGPCFERVV